MAVDYSKLFGKGYEAAYTPGELFRMKKSSYMEDPVFGRIKVPDGFELVQDKNGNNMLWANDLILNPQLTKPEEPKQSSVSFDQPDEDNEVFSQSKNQNVKVNNSIKGDKKYVFDFFYNKLLELNKNKENSNQLSQIQAAGMVGNLIHESGLQTGIKGDGGKALGLAQWHPDRQKGLKALADSRGVDITDLDTQLEYIWQELNSTEKKALNSVLNSKTVEQATTAFMRDYERPGAPHLNSRINYAKSFFS